MTSHSLTYFQLIRVLIIAYQRTGSSFLGELYNQHPDAFYWFEPVDGMYASMYGTTHGWVIPTDIYSLENGTKRYIVCIYCARSEGEGYIVKTILHANNSLVDSTPDYSAEGREFEFRPSYLE